MWPGIGRGMEGGDGQCANEKCPVKSDRTITSLSYLTKPININAEIEVSHPFYHSRNHGEDSYLELIPANKGNHNGVFLLPAFLS